MLENRPITQRSLVATGAFVFVFGAAMAGSAFMISGGFGLGGDNERVAPTPLVDPITVQLASWEPEGSVNYTAAIHDAYDTALESQPALYSTDDLDGDTVARVPDEAQLDREIERLYEAVQEQARASDVEPVAADVFEDEQIAEPTEQTDSDWIDKKPT